jgi:hypothetical protein
MSILRNKLKSKFSQLPNELITDTRLSHGAFRVAAYLFSRPENWEILNFDIQKQLNIRQSQTLADYWGELIKSGWVTRERKRENGKIVGGFDYELSLIMENPQYGKTLIREDATNGKIHTPNNTDPITNTESSINTVEINAPNGASPKPKKDKLTKDGNLIKAMASDFDVAFSYLSGTSKNLCWGAAATEKIRWSGKEIGNIANLRDALQKRMNEKQVDPTDKDTLENWRMFLEMAIGLKDDFLNRNFTPSFLYSQFNSIILKLNQKKNGKHGNTGPTIISESTKRDAIRELFEEGYFDNRNQH